MIPAIANQQSIPAVVTKYLQTLEQSAFSGDIEFSYASRLTVATDNSVYQQLPQAVLLPKSTADIVEITQIAQQNEFAEITFGPRGGGTGTNGQSLTPGIVVDLSRHMRKVIEINPEQGWVKVQAGVIKDQLNDALRPHGFFFAPDLSTSNRATVGGMINTDASGQGSLVYGKTSDHILALTSVLADGTVIDSQPCSVQKANEIAAGQGSEAELYRQVLKSCGDNRDEILAKFPRLNRFLTGYDLEHVFNHDLSEFDLSRVIAGSEGTLAFVTEAKLNITPLAPFKALVNIKYDSFESALRNSPFLVAAEATSVETVDSTVLNLAKQDIIWHSVSEHIKAVPGSEIDGLNIVEYNAEDEMSIKTKIADLEIRLNELIANKEGGLLGYQVTYDKEAIGKIYAMRKKAVGLLGNAKGDKKPQAFAEDTAVPPEHLADFIMEFRALLDEHKLDYGMFGHVDAGVLHVRPALDLCDPEQEVLMRKISDQVVALTAKYNGLMWGEHGRGYRTEYGPEFFGEHLFNELRKIKHAFDPHNRLNPGKICTPIGSYDPLVSVDAKKRGGYDRQIPIVVKESFPIAMNCNGNGLCFNYDVDSPMCPSYKQSKDRRFSPKGRAGLMREWMRLMSVQNVDIKKEEKRIVKGDGNGWYERFRNTMEAKKLAKTGDLQQQDFSHQVFEAMSTCLACKACASQCPVKVDVPEFRTRFLSIYYDRYSRPLKDHFVGNIEQLAPLMAKMSGLVNGVLKLPVTQNIIEKSIGYVDTPLLSQPTLIKRLQAQYNQQYKFDYNALSTLPNAMKAKTVIVVQDPFTTFYEAQLVEDLFAFITKLGYRPILLPFRPNGKPQYVKGFLKEFTRTAKHTAKFLNKVAQLDIAMIGIDSPMLLCYRDEYNQVLGDERGDFNVLSAGEWLSSIDVSAEHIPAPDHTTKEFYLYGHCTEKTLIPQSSGQWVDIFTQFGLKLNIVPTGCCGMAGTYGHESKNLVASKDIYNMSWQSKVKQHQLENIVVTGFSCRSQVSRLEGAKPKHPIQVLLQNL